MRIMAIVLPAAFSLALGSFQANAQQAAPAASGEFRLQDPAALDAKLRPLIVNSQVALSSLERALLIVDAMEATPIRVRYMVTLKRQTEADKLTDTVVIARYNLGPAIRREAIGEFGAANVAPPAAFGLGPHVEWRIKSIMAEGAEAAIGQAERRQIGEAQAKASQCLIGKCLSLGLDPELPGWSPVHSVSDPKLPRAYNSILKRKIAAAKGSPAESYEELPPARIAMEMLVLAGLVKHDDDELKWPKPPFDVTVMIDRNLGQDYLYDAVLAHQGQQWRCSGGADTGKVFRSCQRPDNEARSAADDAASPPPSHEAVKVTEPVKSGAVAKTAPALSCQFFREKNFAGTPLILKAEKLRGTVAYDDVTELPPAFDKAIQSVRCATGCSYFAHSEPNHDGDEFRPEGQTAAADLGAWSGRFRSLGISCRAN